MTRPQADGITQRIPNHLEQIKTIPNPEPRPPNVPLFRAVWSLLACIWGASKASWGGAGTRAHSEWALTQDFELVYGLQLGMYQDGPLRYMPNSSQNWG